MGLGIITYYVLRVERLAYVESRPCEQRFRFLRGDLLVAWGSDTVLPVLNNRKRRRCCSGYRVRYRGGWSCYSSRYSDPYVDREFRIGQGRV